jgi:hypothetical protein
MLALVSDQDGASVVSLKDFRRAYADAEAAIEAMPDPEQAFAEATALRVVTDELQGSAAILRARMAHRVYTTHDLSLAALAERLDISKARADQLIRLAREHDASKAPSGDLV